MDSIHSPQNGVKSGHNRHDLDGLTPPSSSLGLRAGWLTSPPLPRGTKRMLRVSAMVPVQTCVTHQPAGKHWGHTLTTWSYMICCTRPSVHNPRIATVPGPIQHQSRSWQACVSHMCLGIMPGTSLAVTKKRALHGPTVRCCGCS